MSKLTKALFSFSAWGSLGKALTVRRRGTQTIAEKKPIPDDPKSLAQLSWRHMYQKAVALWHALSAAEKLEWESNARARHMTGFVWFMSQCLRPNPGIYLPLQGGTMQGDIDMATYKITALPAPTANEEPTRKTELDAHIALPAIHHAKYTNAQALAAAIAGGLSSVHWKNASQNVLNINNRAAAIGWTDLDLTAATSANAKVALITPRLHLDSFTGNSGAYFQIRKNGTAPGVWATAYIGPLWGDIVDSWVMVNTLIGVDPGQVVEYGLVMVGVIQVDIYLDVAGYIE